MAAADQRSEKKNAVSASSSLRYTYSIFKCHHGGTEVLYYDIVRTARYQYTRTQKKSIGFYTKLKGNTHTVKPN